MPTYRNDSQQTYRVTDTAGASQQVAPGGSIETYDVLSLDGMTQTAAAPYWNPVPTSGVHDVTSSGEGDDQTISLSAETDAVEIYNGSAAEATVFLRATANTPGMKVPASTIRTIENLKNRVPQLVVQFSAAVTSGQFYVTELKGE